MYIHTSVCINNHNTHTHTHARTHSHTHTRTPKVLEVPKWPEKWPFRAEDFLRYDESDDTAFYSMPRFVYHIDEGAVSALTK